jgi:steroid 5-alpha reductase family enzyme
MNYLLSNLLLSFAISLGINLFFFIFAVFFKTDKLTDFTYGLSFAILALFLLLFRSDLLPQQILVTLLVVIWAVRLVSYLLIRILKIKKDSRFDEIREQPLKFLQFWLLQGISVWLISIPVINILITNQSYQSGLLLIIGSLIWLVGLIIETVADIQKFEFKNNPKNKGRWIQSGLWKYSRHPNYFGEMLVWWGIYTLSLSLGLNQAWWTIIGPIHITFLLRFVTGVPPLEKRYDKRYEDNEEYQQYKQESNLLVPVKLK